MNKSLQVDIDELTDLSLEYGIQSVPVLAVIKNGKVVSSLSWSDFINILLFYFKYF